MLAARPSMGKTSLALNVAEAAALPKKGEPVPTLVFSLEMSARAAGPAHALLPRPREHEAAARRPSVQERRRAAASCVAAADEFSKAPLFIDDSSHLSIMELRAKARRLHARHKLGLIIVDYLQLLSPTDSQVPARAAGGRGFPRIKSAGEGT